MPMKKKYSIKPLLTKPEVINFRKTAGAVATVTEDIRPPPGAVWDLLYASVRPQTISWGAAAPVHFRINFKKGVVVTALRIDVVKDTDTNPEEGGVELFPGKTFLLTNDEYIQLEYQVFTASVTINADMTAVVQVV